MMRKLVFIALLITGSCFGQSDVSINFHNTPLKEALLELESQSGFKFYFDETWLKDKAVTSTNSGSLNKVLGDLLRDLSLNYFIYDNTVIFSNNSVIYRDLPFEYFSNSNIGNSNAVVFYNEYENSQNGNLITIGKQDPNSPETTFTLTGIVRNDNTEEPIPNMSLSVKGQNLYTVTDGNGFFKLNLPIGLNEVTTNLIGYESVTKNILIYGNGSLNFGVSENAEQLDEVLIEAESDNNVKTAVVGVTKIDVAGIKTIPVVLGERDILRVATSLPGIKTAGEGAAGYNVRGGRTDQNLVLLDDGVLYNPSHFLGFFTALNPFTTGSAEIYKASIPAEYGGRLSSVFDIHTKDGNTTKFSGEGSIGPVTANLAIETPIVKEKSSLVTGVRATYSDWILRSLDEESLKNSQASFYD